jgi:hypothetical protein
MKIVCKVKNISTLTYLKVYEATPADRSGFIIIDDFENKRFYYAGLPTSTFMTLEEAREIKLNSLLE